MDDAEGVLDEIAAMFTDTAAEFRPADPGSVRRAVAQGALGRIRGAAAAAVSSHDGRRFTAEYATDDRADGADRLQHHLAAGPTVEVLRGAAVAHVANALGERPGFGGRLARLGYLSALSVRLGEPDDALGPATSLTLYAEPGHAFDPVAVRTATLLAMYGGAALAQARAAERVLNLERALVTTKRIGPAIGLIMAQHRVGHDQAMTMLRKISQRINRKVSDLAAEVVEAGALRQAVDPLTPPGARRPAPNP